MVWEAGGMHAMKRNRIMIAVVVAFVIAGCGAAPGVSSVPASPPAQTTSPTPAGPSNPASAAPSAAALDPSLVPPGLIAYMWVGSDKVEHFFTVDTLGENKHALFETMHCACIKWSPDGQEIWTVTETETGLRHTTMDPDGSNVVVYTPEIETLNLVGGFGTADGRHIGFFGWDDTKPARQGIWAANANLTDLHQVTGVPEGVLAIDPIGMSEDGSHIYFHGDLGENTENEFHHAGNVYVIKSDGTGLRQLNPLGTKTEITGEGLSADGRRLAFTAWEVGSADQGNALFVVDGDDGEARRVTDWTAGLWGAAWAPTGDWLATTQDSRSAVVASLIRPDGTGLRPISSDPGAGASFGPVWSPDGMHFLVRRGEFHANDLWIMDLHGAFIWQVTDMPASYDVYAWANPTRD
jgi:Tol biopolymer transport system component